MYLFWAHSRHYSLVDIVQALTDSVNPTDYLKKLRKRDEELGSYLGTNCPHVEMPTETGKNRQVLAGNTKDVFRLIQSIPSTKSLKSKSPQIPSSIASGR